MAFCRTRSFRAASYVVFRSSGRSGGIGFNLWRMDSTGANLTQLTFWRERSRSALLAATASGCTYSTDGKSFPETYYRRGWNRRNRSSIGRQTLRASLPTARLSRISRSANSITSWFSIFTLSRIRRSPIEIRCGALPGRWHLPRTARPLCTSSAKTAWTTFGSSRSTAHLPPAHALCLGTNLAIPLFAGRRTTRHRARPQRIRRRPPSRHDALASPGTPQR